MRIGITTAIFDAINILRSVRRAYIPELGLSTKAATLMTTEEATEEVSHGGHLSVRDTMYVERPWSRGA